MNNLYKQIGIYASIILMFSACEQYEKLDFHADKPESIAVQEELDAYDALKSYKDNDANNPFLLGASLTSEDYINKGMMYRLVNRNFDEVSASNFNHGSVVQPEGELSLSNIATFIETAKLSKISVFGSALVSSSNQNSTYLNGLIAPLVIPGASGTTMVVDFDGDNLGTTYPMSNGGSGTVVVNNISNSGRVLNVKGAQSFPKFTITLPQGKTLGNYISVTLDMYATGSTGLYGQGMRMSIDGGAVGNYGSPSSYGVGDGVWGMGKIVMPLSTLNLSAQQKEQTSFTLMFGSATGAANYYIDNVSMQWKIEDQIIEKTVTEKKDLIEDAFQNWISSVVDTSKSYVKVWDVVKEPMDDALPTEIKTGLGKTPAAGEFFWQDYLGKDYAVKAFQLARQHGNPGDKLFISENNLATNLAKCNGLISYINYIEDKSVKIDGIGTELNLTVNSDKAQIEEMFRLLASTGKLVRVSGLQVGIGVPKSNATVELYNQQSAMYKFVVDSYFKLIPIQQRYGITVKSLLDLAGASEDPNGLWKDTYIRKPAYVGVVEALQSNRK